VTTLRERNIEIEIPDALSGRRFDDWTHGLSHCMKAVDFIVELTDRILFIEIKNPPDPASLPPNAKGDYVEKLGPIYIASRGVVTVQPPPRHSGWDAGIQVPWMAKAVGG